MNNDCVSAEHFIHELRQNTSRLIVLDCRSSNEYSESHVRQAVNFSIPSIVLRRLQAGSIELVSTIKCRELKAKISDGYHENLFIVYGDSGPSNTPDIYNNTLEVLTKRLKQDGCQVACLDDGLFHVRARGESVCRGGGGGAKAQGASAVAALPLYRGDPSIQRRCNKFLLQPFKVYTNR
ncbi:hypothetical protein B566_EDAN009599 [Ephemera danica]|nr:hypothetical protein B566_EDAN009599 [Ephemera danica]